MKKLQLFLLFLFIIIANSVFAQLVFVVDNIKTTDSLTGEYIFYGELVAVDSCNINLLADTSFLKRWQFNMFYRGVLISILSKDDFDIKKPLYTTKVISQGTVCGRTSDYCQAGKISHGEIIIEVASLNETEIVTVYFSEVKVNWKKK